MKKILSVLLSVAMLFGTLAISGMQALAATKDAAPEVAIGSTIALDVAPMDVKTYQNMAEVDENEAAEKLDIWYAKITPQESGWYEFVCDTKYTCKGLNSEDFGEEAVAGEGTMAICLVGLTNSKNEDCGFSTSMNLDLGEVKTEDGEFGVEFLIEMMQMLGLRDTPAFTTQLKKGETYYLSVINVSKENYKTNIRIAKHTHTMKDAYKKSAVKYDKDFDMFFPEEGFKGKVCASDYCEYEKRSATYSAVNDIVIKKQTYTGKAIKPTVQVKLMNGKTLSKKYYTVKFSNNKNVGNAKATIKFKGNYKGTVKLRFKIVPKGTTLKSVKAAKRAIKVSWKKQAVKTSGYQIQYATDKKFRNAVKVNVKGAKNTAKTIKKLKSGKKYYVRIRTYKVVNGDKYFSKWSKTKTVKL